MRTYYIGHQSDVFFYCVDMSRSRRLFKRSSQCYVIIFTWYFELDYTRRPVQCGNGTLRKKQDKMSDYMGRTVMRGRSWLCSFSWEKFLGSSCIEEIRQVNLSISFFQIPYPQNLDVIFLSLFPFLKERVIGSINILKVCLFVCLFVQTNQKSGCDKPIRTQRFPWDKRLTNGYRGRGTRIRG